VNPLPQPGAITLLITIFVTCLLFFISAQLICLIVPALLALIVYYCLRPIVEVLVIRGMRHEVAAMVVWITLQLLTTVIVFAIGFLVVEKASKWQANFAGYLAGAENLIKNTVDSLDKVFPALKKTSLGTNVDQRIQQFTNEFAEANFLPIALRLAKWLPSLLLLPYITYFLLSDSGRLKKYIIKSVPNAFFERALLLFSRLDASLQSYFQGLLVLTCLDTMCLSAGLGMLRIKGALWLGLIAAVLSWVPYIGSIIGCIVVVLVAATDFPDKPSMAYACVGLFILVRVLDDFVFLPLTVGRKLHVHPLLSVLMLFLGADVAGATGLFLALPLFGVVTVIGETISQVVMDPKLRARYKASRRLTQ
jgi:predicted PurR-regulated permease PerM